MRDIKKHFASEKAIHVGSLLISKAKNNLSFLIILILIVK